MIKKKGGENNGKKSGMKYLTELEKNNKILAVWLTIILEQLTQKQKEKKNEF